MTTAPDTSASDRALQKRIGQPVIVVILLDVLTLGIYSVARTYWLHEALAKETGRRLFADAFLHVLMLLNLALLLLRFSRESQPLDATVIFTRLGAALLFISLLLVFRRTLAERFHLRIRTLPLALFGFWYLQYRLNRFEKARSLTPSHPASPSGSVLAVMLYVGLGLLLGCMKEFGIPSTSMEPTLTVGDRVLVEQLFYPWLNRPQRADLLAFVSPEDKAQTSVKRVLGLPGDRISMHGHRITINDRPLPCVPKPDEQPGAELLDHSPKHVWDCSLNGKTFTLHHYQQGALTAVDGDFEVPPDHYFLVGDNLDQSADSRTMGAVPSHLIVGRVWARTLSYRPGESIPWNRWFHAL